jgi:hypothetical protein
MSSLIAIGPVALQKMIEMMTKENNSSHESSGQTYHGICKSLFVLLSFFF